MHNLICTIDYSSFDVDSPEIVLNMVLLLCLGRFMLGGIRCLIVADVT